MELKPWFEQNIEGEECIVCQEIVFQVSKKTNLDWFHFSLIFFWSLQGERCATPNCSGKMHHLCASKWFEGKAEPKCPNCSASWKRKAQRNNSMENDNNNNTEEHFFEDNENTVQDD